MQNINYAELELQLSSLLDGQTSWYSNLSQFSAFLNDHLDDINWVGFYLVNEPGKLKLGPFQGKVACVDIPFGRGVCGTAAETGETQIVADVHAFAGHIACDAQSNSEIVIPLSIDSKIQAVLDIDSPSFDRFSEADGAGLRRLTDCLIKHTDWPASFN